LIERVRQIPGIQSADLTALVPLSQTDNAGPFWTGSQKPTIHSGAPRATFYWTGPEYCERWGYRCFEAAFSFPKTTTQSERVVVIDSVLARTYFSGKDPVGQIMMIPHWGSARVIGVVGHVRHWDLGDSNRYTQNQIYVSFYQLRDEWVPVFRKDVTVAVRTSLDSATLMPAIKRWLTGGRRPTDL